MRLVNPAALLLLACTVLFSLARADALQVTGRVVDDSGVAIADAVVSLRNAQLAAGPDGGFAFELDSPTTVMLEVSAPGFYTFNQTLHRSDFVIGRDAVIPPIELVKKKPGRTLLLFAGDSMLARRYFEPRAGARPAYSRRPTSVAGRYISRGVHVLRCTLWPVTRGPGL